MNMYFYISWPFPSP